MTYVDGIVDVFLITIKDVEADSEGLDATSRSSMAFLLLFLLLFFFLIFLLLLLALLLFGFVLLLLALLLLALT